MKQLLCFSIFLLVILGLHCYALHKRIEYLTGALADVQDEFYRFARANPATVEVPVKEQKQGGAL